MKIHQLYHSESHRLILIFAGWSMDAAPFAGLHRTDSDIAVAFDYTEPDRVEGGEPQWDSYEEICIIAWSYGVVPAARFIDRHPELPVTLRTAVNGTMYPVDDLRGIPSAIFRGTLDGLSEATLTRFHRRMCGGSQAYREFATHLPGRRDIASLQEELRSIAALPGGGEARWDSVIISDSDMIIPTENQRRAWEGHPNISVVPGSHLPDFNAIINSAVNCKPLIADRFARAKGSYDRSATIQQRVAHRLSEMLMELPGACDCPDAIEIGAGSGVFTRAYLEAGIRPKDLQLWDIAHINPELPGRHVICDGETAVMRVPAASADLIMSASTVQWFNSPATFLHRCARALRGGGILGIATYGPATYRELPIDTPAHYLSAQTWKQIVPQEFEILAVTSERLTAEFRTTRELLKHISGTGVNATQQSDRVGTVRRILASGITTLTYEPLYLILRRR